MTQDEQSIHDIVSRMEDAWNAGDAAGFAAPFTEDADFINVLGDHHQGRPNIEAGHAYIFRTIYRGSRNRYQVEGVRFPTPDTAIAFVSSMLEHNLATRPDDRNRDGKVGEARQNGRARPTLFLKKHGSGWRIVALQNTMVAN